jgi:type II secretory pathway component GspD/PulD (secretin)
VNADIGNVLKALAIQTGANIVTSPDVKGTVTVSLSGVTVDNALDLITKLSNLKYAKIENTYIVGTPGTINAMAPMMTDVAANVKPSLVVDVVRVQYGDLKAIGSAVSEVMKDIAAQEGFKVIDGASSGSGSSSSSDGKMGDQRIERYLILTGSIKAVAIGKQVAIDLDRQFAEACAAGQVMEVFHARHTDAIKLKAALEGQIQMAMGSSGSSSGSSSSGGDTGNKAFPLFPVVRISIGPNPAVSSHDVMATETSESNSSSSGGSSSSSGSTTIEPPMTLVFQGPAAEVAKAIAFAKVLDAPPPQVQIEAKVVDINIDDMKKWGLDWDFLNSSTVNDAPGQSKFSGTIPAGTDPLTSASFTISKFFNDFRYTVKIDAMLRNYNAKILASPRVSVLDSRYAQIFIGDEVKYVESISQTPTGQNITIGTVKAGIQLNVAPRISPEDGTITMNIHPEVSMIYDYLEVPGGGSLPQIARRYADTTIRVKDGETIVIGGLIREDDLKTVKKVPLLGELPLLGYLFTNYKLNKTRNEIVIFITPRIVKD